MEEGEEEGNKGRRDGRMREGGRGGAEEAEG